MKKTLTVLSLVTLLLFSLTALAASKNGFSTSMGGRQTKADGAAKFFAPSFQPDAGEAVIYNNLSNYPLGVYWCCSGWTISGPNSVIGATYADGMPFTPAANGKVNKIVVAVGYVTGTNGVTVSLNKDAGGLPGSVIGKFDAAGLPPFGSCCVTIFKSAGGGGAPITAGTQYWVVVQTTAKTQDTWDAWNDNDTNQTAQPFAFYNNGSWVNTSGVLGAFAVLGQ